MEMVLLIKKNTIAFGSMSDSYPLVELGHQGLTVSIFAFVIL